MMSAVFAVSAHAQETYLFDEMVISATRTEQALSDIAASIDLVTDKQISEKLAQDLEQAVAREPGVSMPGVGRFGNSGFTIRGLSDDYVKTIIDGVEQPGTYNPDQGGGAFGAANVMRKFNNTVETDTLQRVEINKGPSSSLYGSDALAGAVIIRTKNPSDLLPESLDVTTGSIKTGYYSADESYKATVTVANRYNSVESLLIFTHRKGHETKNHSSGADVLGSSRGQADPFDFESDNLLFKMYYQANDAHRFGFTGEIYNQTAQGITLSKEGTSVGPNFVYTNNHTDDENQRYRASIEHSWNNKGLLSDDIKWQLTWLETKSLNNTFDTTDWLGDRKRERYGVDKSQQFDLQLNKAILLDNATHELSYGANYVDNKFNLAYQDVNMLTGTATDKTGEVPNASSTKWGIYLQDQAFLLADTLVLNAGLRYDSHKIKPLSDPTKKEVNNTAFTGKLGGVYHWTDSFSTYVNVSQGFKSPTVQDLYFFYGGYGASFLPNPDLKPEESIGYETGLRFNTAATSTHFSLFYNDYSNFIETISLGYIDGSDSYTKENVNKARIYGAELKTSVALGHFGLPKGLYTSGSLAYAQGKNKSTGYGLDSVAPLTGNLSLGYRHPNERFGTEFALKAVARKSGKDWSDPSNIAAPGYTLTDLTAYYKPLTDMTIRGGVFNILDKKYWDYADLTGAGDTKLGIDFHTQAGRNWGIELEYTF